MRPITVITLDDHYLVRHGIRSLLNDDPTIELVGEGGAGEHLDPLLQKHKPDIVLLDIGMPQTEGVTDNEGDNTFHVLPAIARVLRHYPDMNIIIVSQYASQALIEGSLELGVKGYVLKGDVLSEHLTDAIRTVHRGGTYLSEGVGKRLNYKRRKAQTETILTARQAEVMQMIAANPDLSYADHAAQMQISEHTFNNHLRQIFSRLSVSSLAAAIVKAVQLGIISVDTPVGEYEE
ncbi:MAG: response regulator transcription factor [Chloroflexi bacterium]|nr:response regulator transcription factor [Chloroflexota bacterium]